MKNALGYVLLVLAGVLLGFGGVSATATVSRYREQKAQFTDFYLTRIRVYADWQYKQAEPKDAKRALTDYSKAIASARAAGVRSMDQKLAFEAVLTDLRLYRLAMLAGDKPEADQYMDDARQEQKALGWDLPQERLAELIETRESKELEVDKKTGTIPTASPKAQK